MSMQEIFVSKFIDKTKPKFVWDLGANTGRFSQICNDKKYFYYIFR